MSAQPAVINIMLTVGNVGNIIRGQLWWYRKMVLCFAAAASLRMNRKGNMLHDDFKRLPNAQPVTAFPAADATLSGKMCSAERDVYSCAR